MFGVIRLVAAFIIATLLLSPLQASIINTFDNPGDVILSPTQAPGTWYVDRYPPAGFAAGQIGGGRTGVLHHFISANDASNLRPPSFSTAFYNTQGRKFDLPSGTTAMGIELYVPSDWANLNQNVLGAEGRLGSFWGTAVDSFNTISFYPIIEYNNQAGFRVWNNGVWINVPGFTGYDKWYDLAIEIDGANFNYYINSALVATVNALGSTQLSNVILQGYNAGNSYNIYWDNLRNSTFIPEPTTLALFGLMGTAALSYRVRRRFRS